MAVLPRRRDSADAGRADRRILWPESKAKEIAPEGIFAELARQHYDTANATSVPAMTALLKLVPVSQVTYGTDYPYLPLDQKSAYVTGSIIMADGGYRLI